MFEGNNLLAKGVLMEGYSVEDNGDGICYNVFCYNAQPGITINYATGDSTSDDGPIVAEQKTSNTSAPAVSSGGGSAHGYIGNKSTKKFHKSSCSSVDSMKESNKAYLECTRDEAISKGYEPCKRCNP